MDLPPVPCSFNRRQCFVRARGWRVVWSYVTAGEVTTLEHELGNHTVELAVGIAEALLAGAERAEVLDGLWDDVVEELEVDTAGAGCKLHVSIAQAR